MVVVVGQEGTEAVRADNCLVATEVLDSLAVRAEPDRKLAAVAV